MGITDAEQDARNNELMQDSKPSIGRIKSYTDDRHGDRPEAEMDSNPNRKGRLLKSLLSAMLSRLFYARYSPNARK